MNGFYKDPLLCFAREYLVAKETLTNRVSLMNCNRCGGVMTYEGFYGPHERFLGWRCVYCGEIIDEVILENREWFRKKVMSVKKRRRSYLAEQ